jgi:hypothetical protein
MGDISLRRSFVKETLCVKTFCMKTFCRGDVFVCAPDFPL